MLAEIDPSQVHFIELGAAAGIFALLLLLGRWLKHSQRVPLGFTFIIFSLAFAGWLSLHFVENSAPPQWRAFLHSSLGLGSIFFGAFVLIAVLHRYYWEMWWERHMKSPSPKFLSQITAIIIVTLAVYIVVALGGWASTGLQLSATAVIAIAGFASQETLANTVAGIALQVGKPFKVGDWLIVDGKHAEVTEMNWRSTRLRDNDEIYFDIPNKTLVGSTITNLTHPRRRHGIRIPIGFEYGSPPNDVKEVLRRAAINGFGVLSEPAPKVFLKDFGDSAVVYEIRFWMEDESLYNDILDSVKTNVWYEAKRAGLNIPFPIRTLQLAKPGNEKQQSIDRAREVALATPVLAVLGQEKIDHLLTRARLLRFGRGERIIRQGDPGASMFLFLEGSASVSIEVSGQSRDVATLRGGDCAGEMSLLTGEPRSASVTAVSDCEVWELDKDTISDLLHENNGLADKLSELLAERKLRTDGAVAATQPAAESARRKEYKEGFLTKLYAFFEL